MPNIIEITNLSFRYPGATQDTLRNVDLTIERGDFVAVVGGNGSGKTTLCKTLNGLVPHYWAGEFAGMVRVDGVDTYESSVAALSSRVGYVYQDFQNQLVRPTVRDEVSFGPVNFGLDDHAERTDEALRALRIEELADRFVWQLSGGQAHLTALASVLAMRPEIIVVDEPVAELDPARAREIYQNLAALNRELGITIITIEHHAEFVARYANSVVLMADGAPVWHLPVAEAMQRAAELEQHGIPAPQVARVGLGLGIEVVPRTPVEAAGLIRAAGLSPRSDWRPTDADQSDGGKVVASTHRVAHGYKTVGGALQTVLPGLGLELRAGQRVALVGGNGAGKTTLLKLLAGITVAREGEVVIDGVNTRSQPAHRLADRAAYLYQHPQQMFLTDSVRSDVTLFPKGRRVADTAELVDRIVERVRLTELADRDGRTLSGGQQRRATLAIGLAMRPTLLLLDEPTSSLDVASRDDVTAMLDELADSIECTVIATHDMHLVAEWASRVIVLDGGRIAADVTARELFGDPELLARANLVPPQITELGLELGMHPVPLRVEELLEACRPDPLGSQAAGETPLLPVGERR
ncbi:ABC transporter ATP-binding protein [Actinoalloteichus hymeniacidonis]|uniref:ABC transporter n=1 Tax=Actinoalloteichus hymeniacidonis TaxID=340345 RepID=A0AAC9HMB2_9PSEU|nr:ATP-binding cassette domain-containing protein [Actinoalloteichus hymeniacidonis]AOS61947.1 ABC transporter [Actinoalloteichus hymeniacidonis]MBB5910033.1 energy-coupling factor transport system ATP-binding protein [Actinoalloteichus hymeniacidonis]